MPTEQPDQVGAHASFRGAQLPQVVTRMTVFEQAAWAIVADIALQLEFVRSGIPPSENAEGIDVLERRRDLVQQLSRGGL